MPTFDPVFLSIAIAAIIVDAWLVLRRFGKDGKGKRK